MKKSRPPERGHKPVQDAGASDTLKPGLDQQQQVPQNNANQGRQHRQPIDDARPKEQPKPPQEQTQKSPPRWKRRPRKQPKYKLPESYEAEFQVQKDLGAGAFGETALIQVISEGGGITKFFKLKKGDIIASKRIPIKKENDEWRLDRYYFEWMILRALRGHENIIAVFGSQDPGPGNWFGHIFMEFCNMGDVEGMRGGYAADFSTMLASLGFDCEDGSNDVPPELSHYQFLPEGFVYEFVTSIAKGLAWMHCGIKNWPKDCTVPNKWSPVMHNDIKPDNILMMARPSGDKCLYPIFKIADFGAASVDKGHANIFSQMAAPERRANGGTIPATPKDDIYTLGHTVYVLCWENKIYESRFDPLHRFFASKGRRGTTNSKPDTCPEPHRKHFRVVRPCAVKDMPDCMEFKAWTLEKRINEHTLPYSEWFDNLIEDCIELKRQHRPDTLEVLERMTTMRKAYGEGTGGSPRLLWNPLWLPNHEERMKEIEEERQKMPPFEKVPKQKSPPKQTSPPKQALPPKQTPPPKAE
ncbi:hypothetical protein TWF694_005496 [Orbilia ellipsospora]|uniref:non-specific serine/threonine protein kinase n=1 Tax=Orbilia ellipsospora TaxID=2528407 RepID=A0AAV9WVQ8_9PEZI